MSRRCSSPKPISDTPTSCSMNTASSSTMVPENSCKRSCRRSRIGSRRIALSASAGTLGPQIEVAGKISKLYWPHPLEFVAAHFAEAPQQIDRAIDGHFAQFDEALVRLQIGIQNFSDNVVGVLDHLLRGHRPHRAQL